MIVTTEYDTVSKNLVVKRDGITVEDVSSLDFYLSYDGDNKFRMNLAQDRASADKSYSQRMTTMAKLLGFETDEN
jgi:hypothetical protein